MTEKRKCKELIIRDYGSNKISFGQSTKGIWIVNAIDLYCDSISDGLVLAEDAMERSNEILKKINKPLEADNEIIKKES